MLQFTGPGLCVSVSRSQESIGNTFAALQLETPRGLSEDELRRAVTKAEECYLQTAGTLAFQASEETCAKAWAGVIHSANLYDVKQLTWSSEPHTPKSLLPTQANLARSCWLANTYNNTQWPAAMSASPACHPTPESLLVRPAILKQYASLQLYAGELGRLLVQRKQRLLFFGHSVHTHAFHAARCEMLRTVPEALPRLEHEAGFAGKKTSVETAIATLARRLSDIKVSDDGGTVVASLGMNYNNRETIYSKDQAAFSALTREDYRVHLHALMSVLDSFSANCTTCTSIFATSHLQHFDMTADGAFARTILDPSVNVTEYGCGPPKLPYKELRTSSPNSWRSADAIAAAAKFQHVLVVPMHSTNGYGWSMHPGWAGTARFRTHKDGKHRTTTLDCAHYCYSPFIYQPLWRALAMAIKGRGTEL